MGFAFGELHMNTAGISDKLMDCAIDLAVASLPGLVMNDSQAMGAYKQLAGEMLLKQPVKRLKKLLPLESRRLALRGLRYSVRRIK